MAPFGEIGLVGHSVEAIANSLSECTISVPPPGTILMISTLVKERCAWRKKLTDI